MADERDTSGMQKMQDADKFYSKHYCSIFYALSMFISLEFRILGRECITS